MNVSSSLDSSNVIIRMAQSGDKVVQPTAPLPQQVKPQESKPIPTSSIEIKKVAEQTESASVKEAEAKRLESDQEKMVLDLFDGKYVE